MFPVFISLRIWWRVLVISFVIQITDPTSRPMKVRLNPMIAAACSMVIAGHQWISFCAKALIIPTRNTSTAIAPAA